MEIPEWLKQKPAISYQPSAVRKAKERFLDKTLRHVLAFTEDALFNETTSLKNGFLQKIEPRLKVLTVMVFIVMLSLQNDIHDILIFLYIAAASALISKIPFYFFMKRLLPAFLFTFFIAAPATLNIIVKGEALWVVYTLENPYSIGWFLIPQEIYITKQGALSALTLLLRVTASVSLILLVTLTTRPNRFIKAVSSFMPGTLGSIVSISYRYIFLLARKVEQFIMGFKSRSISSASHGVAGRKWAASRMGLLFSISLRLSAGLEQAMEARGYKNEFKIQNSKFKVSELSGADIIWIIFSVIFMGAMVWKSLM
ncbi:MAG: hypothetical protein EPN94_04395 [Nitrospirae bacterium]|nr:MAG: hypothetical protein EPN94_04395 [Nitrospirota bacterium]